MNETSWGRRKYRTKNWKAYNAALKARGDLTIWLDKD
ncbi:MAG: IS5/IS1182 family transposase, partial [Comamonas sp.]